MKKRGFKISLPYFYVRDRFFLIKLNMMDVDPNFYEHREKIHMPPNFIGGRL